MPTSLQGHRLGRNPSLEKNIVRRVMLRDFLDHARVLPTLPSAYLPPPGYRVPMYLNDQLGDCGPAACAHAVGQNSLASSGVERLFADAEVRDFYFGITGGQDSGVDMEQMFSYWRKHPLGNPGEAILAYAFLTPGDTDQLEAAQFIFEGAVINGASLPDRVVPNMGDWLAIPWTGTSGAADPNNGHAFNQPGYVARGGPYFVGTWADCRDRMDKPFYVKYVDAPAVVLTQSIINTATQRSAGGFSADQLLGYVAEITGGPVPPPEPPPPPAPNPPGCLSAPGVAHVVRSLHAILTYIDKHKS